jgi:hypothetical protein
LLPSHLAAVLMLVLSRAANRNPLVSISQFRGYVSSKTGLRAEGSVCRERQVILAWRPHTLESLELYDDAIERV